MGGWTSQSEYARIAWPYDYPMKLFSQPAVLAVFDSAPLWCEKYTDCCAFNPGQFGKGGTYVQYFTAERRTEISSIS
jgi:hypothetical protein